jgi:hypothetical protein
MHTCFPEIRFCVIPFFFIGGEFSHLGVAEGTLFVSVVVTQEIHSCIVSAGGIGITTL